MYGGAASGKSRYAEDLLCALSGEGPRIYLATMEAMDEESRARVRRHRALRQNKGFSTLECPRDLGGLTIPVGSSVLLEDLGNLWANELFSPSGFDPDGALLRTAEGLERLSVQAQNLVVVSADGLARLHRLAAGRCGRVIEVVCGLPVIWKEECC